MPDAASLNLAVIGNCQVAALIDQAGAIVWACWPQPDGDPIFCALLDAKGREAERGIFAVQLRGQATVQQEYIRNTAIVQTRLRDRDGGEVLVTDFCPRFRTRGRIFRPATIVRIIEPVSGRPFVRIRLRPLVGYGSTEPTVTSASHHLRFSGEGITFRATTDGSLASLQHEQYFVLDHAVTVLIGPDETVEDQVSVLARHLANATHEYWSEWVRTLAIPFDWQQAVIRSALTLKLCTYEDTGAVLAALTTSIPEVSGSKRNWDYRYCWLRDAFFVIQALNHLGATRTMEGFLRFIEQVVSTGTWDDVRPLYRITGVEPIDEVIVPSLSGYRGQGPVRVGNQAAQQRQYDVYGSLVLASAQLFFDQRLSAPGDVASFLRLEVIGEQAVALFGKPDAGPWELRGVRRAHTFSAMMCWAACDRLARIAEKVDRADRASVWRQRAEQMREDILQRAWNESRGAYVSTLDGGSDLDATALLLPELGLLDAAEPRFLATLAAIEKELIVNGVVMRYRHADDFGVPENAFTVCSFWYVNALSMVGRHADAVRHFEALLACQNHVGLLSEDVDPTTRELWGNFPQTYSLVGVIGSAVRLSRPWKTAI